MEGLVLFAAGYGLGAMLMAVLMVAFPARGGRRGTEGRP